MLRGGEVTVAGAVSVFATVQSENNYAENDQAQDHQRCGRCAIPEQAGIDQEPDLFAQRDRCGPWRIF